MNFYNEIDEKSAAWLRELIKEGHLAPGVVDTRDIRDIEPRELDQFIQCHFFAGIGGWPYALDLAGWPRERRAWTGSCPCQPFSAAGKGGGFDDERHLWPAFDWLIDQCRPENLFGEQVSSPAGLLWLDLVQADLEGKNYAFWTADLCAAGISAPHLRQRTWWLADAQQPGLEGRTGQALLGTGRREEGDEPRRGDRSLAGVLADTDGGNTSAEGLQRSREHRQQSQNGSARALADADGTVGEFATREGARSSDATSARAFGQPERQRDARALADAASGRRGEFGNETLTRNSGHLDGGDIARWTGAAPVDWRDCDWLSCRDGKWRPVEPGTFPLAHGVSGRMGLLRGYGNAIVPLEAAEFVATYLDVERATA